MKVKWRYFIMFLSTIVSFFMTIYPVVMTGFLFEKCGERGWKAIVPFYSTYTRFKLAKAKGLGIVMMFLMAAGIIAAIAMVWEYYDFMSTLIEAENTGRNITSSVDAYMSSAIIEIFALFPISMAASIIGLIGSYKLGKQFDQEGGFLIGMMFLPVIFESILAFSSSYRYEGSEYDWST